ncbi:MAG: HD domain-containing protein [Chloroflexi bacterium]|nr:MAG: HD domain-containing protein [Chloroflexota bacterium]
MGVLYRVRQFWQVWRPEPWTVTESQAVSAVLSPAEQALFNRFNDSDRWHGWRVWQMLLAAGHTHPDLQVAALLHDVGKTRVSLRVWERVLIVLAEAVWPGASAVLGQGEPRGWKRPFVVRAQHARWGAEMAANAGSRPLAVALIRRHQDPLPETAESEEDRLLALLQWADNQN